MVLHGPSGCKIDTIAKAVWYVKEHEQQIQTIKDGVFVIDTSKAENIQDIYKEIIKELRLDCIEHDG